MKTACHFAVPPAWCASVVVASLIAPTWADSWGPPEPEHWSRNGEYVLKVDWGSGKPDRLALWRKTDKGQSEIWSRGYVDDSWPPHAAYVANDGSRVVLRDVYSNLGYGKVLVFLGPKGEVIRGHELNEILTDDEILRTCHSISSIWWSEPGWFSLRDPDRQFAFVTQTGTIRCFDTMTGDRFNVDETLRERIVAEATADAQTLLADPEPRNRLVGATMLGALSAVEGVPALKEVLRDPSVTSQRGSGFGRLEPYRGIQVAAANALIRIMGPDAIPLIEKQLASPSVHMQKELLGSIARLDSDGWEAFGCEHTEAAIAAWDRLLKHESDHIRRIALAERLKRDDATYLRKHADLVKSKDPNVRYWAIRCLHDHATQDDLPLVRRALKDGNDVDRLWAWRTLVRLKPPDIDKILKWGERRRDRTIRFEATLALARRGNADAISDVFGRVESLPHHSHEKEGWSTEEFEADDLCRLVAELKLTEAKPALRNAVRNACEDIQRSACGALATFGDAAALAELRQFARKGHALDRASAIRWLGFVGDGASEDLLKEAITDEEPDVREAAREAIDEIKRSVRQTG